VGRKCASFGLCIECAVFLGEKGHQKQNEGNMKVDNGTGIEVKFKINCRKATE
jgi:hypothetical protein